MASILLFHSILGLRDVEHQLADILRADGHAVLLPDLYEGETAKTYDEGFALQGEIGDTAILARAETALEEASETAVLAGVSFGAFLVGSYWAKRPKMPGALFIGGGAEWMTPRRARLPVSAHIARPDPFDDESVFEKWSNDAGTVALELHRYDDVGHYFLDPSLVDYNADAAELCIERCREFLRRIDSLM